MAAGGTGYWSYSSCASAYMLMYRRKDPELNIRSVGEADLPATLTAEIAATAEKEAAEKEREREETERKHRVLELTAFGPESAADIELEKSATLAQATALVRKALGIGDDVAPDCVRLREWSKYDNVTIDLVCRTVIAGIWVAFFSSVSNDRVDRRQRTGRIR